MLKDMMTIAVYPKEHNRAIATIDTTLKETASHIAYLIPGFREIDDDRKEYIKKLIYDQLENGVRKLVPYNFREFLEEIAADIMKLSMQFMDSSRLMILLEARELTDDELIELILED